MAPRYDIVTFDCYGTLIDWEQGIREAFASTALAIGHPVDTARAVALYGDIEAAIEAPLYRSYREVLIEAARRLAAELHWPLPESRIDFLVESLPYWRPFPDTNRALLRLTEAGYRLGILSNVDDELLAWTRRHFLARFDVVVTAEQVRSYKPAPPHFTTARALIGSASWMHAAQSYYHDIAPARSLRIPVAWVNRKGETDPDGGKPDLEVRTLGDLADWLAP